MSIIYYDSQFDNWAASAWKRWPDPPLDLHVVSEYLGIQVEFTETLASDIFGLYSRLPDGTALIGVNAFLDTNRQRFTWAHEIGHHLIGKNAIGEIRFQCRRGDTSKLERDCNKFASALLMPEFKVREIAELLSHSPENNKTESLAYRFDVSRQAMRIRMKELGLI